ALVCPLVLPPGGRVTFRIIPCSKGGGKSNTGPGPPRWGRCRPVSRLSMDGGPSKACGSAPPLFRHRFLEGLPSLERGDLAGRNLDIVPRLRIAPPPGCPLAHLERAETDDLHPFAAGEGFSHRFKHCIHRPPDVLFG